MLTSLRFPLAPLVPLLLAALVVAIWPTLAFGKLIPKDASTASARKVKTPPPRQTGALRVETPTGDATLSYALGPDGVLTLEIARSRATTRYVGSLTHPYLTVDVDGTLVASAQGGQQFESPVVRVRDVTFTLAAARGDRRVYDTSALRALAADLRDDPYVIAAASRVEPVLGYFLYPLAFLSGEALDAGVAASYRSASVTPPYQIIWTPSADPTLGYTIGGCIFNCEFWNRSCSRDEIACVRGCEIQHPNTPVTPSMYPCPEYFR